MRWLFAWALLLGALNIGSPLAAQMVPAPTSALLNDDLAGAQEVPDKELEQNRGGFAWAGMQISLGAEMRTYINGALVLQTNVTWNDSGAHTTQVVSGSLTPADASQLELGILTGDGITMTVGNQRAYLANQGQTVLIQRNDDGLQNVLVNRASNIQISQQIDATIGLRNFGQFQRSLLSDEIGGSLAQMVGQAVVLQH